jgi:uncharacterized protein YutE (UPF0331/DUF86 family)
MAGYRHRLVHFYSHVSKEELFQLCSERLGDVEDTLEAILVWVRDRQGSGQISP